MTHRLLRLFHTLLLCAWLASCGGNPAPVTDVQATGLRYTGAMAVIGLNISGNALDNSIKVYANDASCIVSPPASASNRSATCILTVPASLNLPVRITSASDYTVYSTTLTVPAPQVTFKTSLGDFVMELNPTAAPITVKNFLKYVNASFYKNTVFHRIIPNTVTQGGSKLADGTVPVIDGLNIDPIELEVGKGLSNISGSVAMARSDVLKSATSGFFVNLKDNTYYDTLGGGYAVFGKVISGLDLLKQIAATVKPGTTEVPATVVTVTSATQTQ